jgi:hypothetical protein
VRFSPRSVFFTVVALGLPFAISAGWTLGTPLPVQTPVSAPGSSDGIGAAPPPATTTATSSVVDYAPRRPEPVAVKSSLPGPSVATTPSDVAPSVIVPSGSPDPSDPPLSPEPSPTWTDSGSPSPSASESPESADPEASELDGHSWPDGLKLRDRG